MNLETLMKNICWSRPGAISAADFKAHAVSNQTGSIKGAPAQDRQNMTEEEKAERYANILEEQFRMTELEDGVALTFEDDATYEFDFYHRESDTFIKFFDEICPICMTNYHELRDEETQILMIIDAECLPCAEFAEAFKFNGIPPRALVAAVRVDAQIYFDGMIISSLGHFDGEEFAVQEEDLDENEI